MSPKYEPRCTRRVYELRTKGTGESGSAGPVVAADVSGLACPREDAAERMPAGICPAGIFRDARDRKP